MTARHGGAMLRALPSSSSVAAVRRRPAPPPRHVAVDVLAAAAGLGLGVVIALAFSGTTAQSESTPAGALTFGGRLAGLTGAYAMLLVVLLAGRLAVLERAIGQDRLIGWHRRLAPWSLMLIGAHVVLTVLGYAQQARTGTVRQAWLLVGTTPGMLTATAGTALLTLAGATSYRRAKARMSHETWWSVHLYTYLGLALSFSHQLTSGAAFATTAWARTFWTALWLGTAGVVLSYRVLLPLGRSALHQLRVAEITEEAPGIVSITLRGRALHRLPLSGGQFLHWRFLRPGMWWQAHPYSVSALPQRDRVRITVKDLGDHSRALALLPVGTRVAFEGPYGAFTADHAIGRGIVAIAGGVGVTPVRALLEDLPAHSNPVVVLRASRAGDLVHAGEIEDLAYARGGRVHRLVGPRERVRLDASVLERLVPDIADRDVYVCGPGGLAEQAVRAALRAGVPAERVHHETFDA